MSILFPYNFPQLFVLFWFALFVFCTVCYICEVLYQLYLNKICDNLLSYHCIMGLFLTSDLLHCAGKTGTWIQIFFHLLHVKTTSYMQQINEQQLHPLSSLSFPHLPLCCKNSPCVIYKTVFPMIWFCPKHSLRPWPIMDALICFSMKEFRVWISPFDVHI